MIATAVAGADARSADAVLERDGMTTNVKRIPFQICLVMNAIFIIFGLLINAAANNYNLTNVGWIETIVSAWVMVNGKQI